MNFLGMQFETVRAQRIEDGRDPASGLTYNELSYMATEGQTSGGPFDDRTKAFLRRCSVSAYEARGELAMAQTPVGETNYQEYAILTDAAEGCVPYGNYDRWVIFTDLVGWENDAYFDALKGMADLDDPSSIPAYVVNNMAYSVITTLIKREEMFE